MAKASRQHHADPNSCQEHPSAQPGAAPLSMLDLQRLGGNRAMCGLLQHGQGLVVQREPLGGPGAVSPRPMLRPPAMPIEEIPASLWELPAINGGATRAAERAAAEAAATQVERVVAEEVVVQVGERIVSRRLLAGIAAVALADEWNPVGWFLDGVLITLLVVDAIDGYRAIKTSAEMRPATSPPSAEAPGASSGVRIVDPVPVRSISMPPARSSGPAQAPGTAGAPVTEPSTGVTPMEAARRADPELDRLIDQAVTLQLEVGAVAAVPGVLVTAVSRGGPRTQSRHDQASSPMFRSIEEMMRDANLVDPEHPDLPYHAEKKMVVQWGGPFAVNSEICHNCWRFLRHAASVMGRRVVVADPTGVYVLHPDGRLLIGPLVVRVPASR